MAKEELLEMRGQVADVPAPQIMNLFGYSQMPIHVTCAAKLNFSNTDIMFVLDNSGSMQDEDKLVHAKQGLLAFFRQVAPQDEIGLTKFSAKVTPLPIRAGALP